MDLWYSFIHSARQLNCLNDAVKPYQLVQLLIAFKKYSTTNNEKYNYFDSALSDFSMACREAYNDAPEPGKSFPLESMAWANMNIFYAYVTREEILDLSLFGLWAMRQALENPHEDDPQSTAVQKYDTYVLAAVVWSQGAGKVLYNKEEDLTPSDGRQGNPAKGGELWKGKAEFSKERWNFWKERFAVIGKMDDVSRDTSIAAKDAVLSMERAATFEKI